MANTLYLKWFVIDTASGLGVTGLTHNTDYTTLKLEEDNTLSADLKASLTIVDLGGGAYGSTYSSNAAYSIKPIPIPVTATYQGIGETNNVKASLSAPNTIVGTDGKALVSTDAQDLSGTFSVNAKKLNGAIPNNLAAGSQMDLISAPNSTAITAIQNGLSKPGTAQTISSNADIVAIKTKTDQLAFTNANKVDAASLITAAPTDMAKDSTVSKPGTPQAISSNSDIIGIKAKTDNLPASPAAAGDKMDLVDIPNYNALTAIAFQCWHYGTRTLSSVGTLISDIWTAATRTLTDKFGFSLTSDYDAAKAAASQTSVNAIPVTPLLTNDTRITTLVNDAEFQRHLNQNRQVWEFIDGGYTGKIFLRDDTDANNLYYTFARKPTDNTLITDPNYAGPVNFDSWVHV